MPVIHNNNEITVKIDATIKLGNLGTNPVFIYSPTTGIPKIRAKAKNISVNVLKKNVGLYSLNSVKIVFSTRNPSRYVFNFDILPSGLSL